MSAHVPSVGLVENEGLFADTTRDTVNVACRKKRSERNTDNSWSATIPIEAGVHT